MMDFVNIIIRIAVSGDVPWQERIKAFKEIGEDVLRELSLSSSMQYVDLSGDDITEGEMRIAGLKKEKALESLRCVLPEVFKKKRNRVMIEEVEGLQSATLPVAQEVLNWYFSR